ncbi:class I adenylate-forming enzyme family protein [Ottowia thiooxydans]|uniref:class I adenylate-forming enzyme family protein n=1 Tax=Ottowia thiooxydans TaxID=219182 RepID=UPI000419FA6F|nr:class I adenylate-forming enzyme family protein [Ottowia thiooxydans]
MGDLFERIKWGDPMRKVLRAWEGAYESPENAELTAARADELANQYANALRSSGVSEGRIVMMVCENSAEALLAKIGMAKAGVTAAPVNPNLSDEVLEQLIELCEPAAMITDSDFAERVLRLAAKSKVPVLHQIRISSQEVPLRSFSEFIAQASDAEPEVEIHGDDIWELLFTSGSTSTPKGVMVSHTNTMFAAMSFNGMCMVGNDYESDLVMCSFLPIIYHVGDGIIYNTIMSGGKAVIGRKLNPRLIAEAIDQEKVTSLWGGAPQAIDAITSEFEKDQGLSSTSLKTVIFGWAPMNPQLHAKAHQYLGAGVKFIEIIGMTEVVCAHRFWIEKHPELFQRTSPQENYVGEPHGLLAAKISGTDGTPIPMGDASVGEAAYRSPALMAGYYRKPEDTREAFRGGWFHGGDAFKWGESGQRILADRFKDIVKTGGENVTCIRVEAILSGHPSVLKTAIVGLPHARWGEAVTAFIVKKTGASVDEEELVHLAKQRLAPFEQPKQYVFLDALPETVGGKVQKHIIRSTYSNLYKERQ